MPIFRWGQSWSTLQDLEREVDRLLQSVNFSFQGVRVGRQFPAVNIYELETEFLLTAEVPGTKSEHLEVSVASGALSIKGKRDFDAEIPEERYRRRERKAGFWERVISLPDHIDDEKMTAEFVNGVLMIHLPKHAQVKPRQIPIVDANREEA